MNLHVRVLRQGRRGGRGQRGRVLAGRREESGIKRSTWHCGDRGMCGRVGRGESLAPWQPPRARRSGRQKARRRTEVLRGGSRLDPRVPAGLTLCASSGDFTPLVIQGAELCACGRFAVLRTQSPPMARTARRDCRNYPARLDALARRPRRCRRLPRAAIVRGRARREE